MLNETNDKIEFAYAYKAIFSKAQLKSIYGAKNMPPTALGEDAVDAYGLSDGEEDYMRIELEKAVGELFDFFIKETLSIEDSLYVGTLKNNIECCGFSINRQMADNKPLYNSNRAKSVDNACEDFLINSVLLAWSKTNKLADDIVIYGSEVENARRRIKLNNFEIKKRKYSETFNVFPQTT